MNYTGYIIGRNIQIPDYPGLFLVGKYGDTITLQMNADGIIDDYDFYLSYKSNYISLSKTIADDAINLSFTIPQNFTNTVGKVFIQVLGYSSGDEPGDTVQWSSLTTQLIIANSQPGPVYPESEKPVVHDFAETNHTGFIVGKNIQLPNYLGMLVEGENITETITLKMGRDNVLDDLEYYLVYKNANNLGDTLALNKVVDSNISLSFVVTDYFTAVKGKMEIQVVGYNAGDTPGTDDPVWESFVSTLMIQRALHPEEIQPEIPTIFVTYLAQMLALKQAAEAAKTGAEYAQGKAEDAQTASEYAQGKAEDAQEAAEIAQGKAEDAQTASETAQGLAEQAQGKAEIAQEKAETAQGKAETAQEKAETAQGKAEDAQELAETAQGKAETAQGKAENAQTAAETAQGKAEDAQELAETAQGKSETAQTAAETAQGLAETAQGKAETAQGKAEQAQSASESAKDTSVANANLSSQYARGKKLNGTDVVSGEDGYQDNSKYYKGLAETANTNAQSARTSAENARDKAEKWAEETEDTPVETGKYSAKHYASKASASATSASSSASSSEDSAQDSEAWAVGQRNGTDVAPTDPTYHNNAKFYSGQASDAKTGAQTAQGLAENARDLAQGYASDASNAKTAAQGYATDADNARISSVSETTSPDDGGTNTIVITYKDGTVKTFTVTNGHTGAPFSIYKTYASIVAMNADLANVPEGKFVIITSTVDDPDNAKLYVRGASSFTYVTDLSGAQGIQGPDGQAATITVGSVQTGSAGSSASVTNSGTSSAAVFDFVIPKGDKGDTGSAGSAATISVGTTTTGQAGTSASVTNSGTSSAAVFNFTIPKGDKGDTGATGSAATVTVGTTTTGNAGTNASVTNSGTSSAAVLNFVIPKGAKGDTGSSGSAATVSVGTTTTGDAGTNASVTNSGTSSAAVLNFTIPKGDKGDTGATGADGAPGRDGVDGQDGTSVTISSTSIQYQTSNSGTTIPTGTWLDNVPSVNQGEFLWTRTIVNYSPSGSTTTYSVAYQGADGQDGQDGADGQGVPTGGTTGQFLKKKSGTNYDTEWVTDDAYRKPSGGIPKTDLASAVQTSLDKADTALQSHQSLADYVKGPSYSVDAHVATFNGAGGKTIKDSGFTIGKSVPSDAVFTDTTYESKSASSGGTAVSLVTTGEKYTWNNKGSYSKPSGGIPKTDLASGVQASLGLADTALPLKMIDRWLRFNPNNKKGLIIKAGTRIVLANGSVQEYLSDTAIDLTSYVTQSGKDYLVYINNSGTVTAYLSTASAPSNSVKIGRFHTLCVNAGTITMTAPASPSSGLLSGDTFLVKPYRQDEDPDFYAFYNKTISSVSIGSYYDIVTCAHPLSGFTAGSILPESVFCLTFHPDTLYEDAMVYDKDTDMAIDVYLQSGTGNLTKSVYGARVINNRQPINHQADMRAVGKKLLSDNEFLCAAIGSNEGTNISGSALPSGQPAGGHKDTKSRRMISAIGCEEMCGYLWQWLDELGVNGGSGWNGYDGGNTFGQHYGTVPYVLRAGGDWDIGEHCGSRSRRSDDYRSYVYPGSSGRGASRVVRNR